MAPRDPQRRYLPLADYGLIGDCHTAALVAVDGSIDWLCHPRFDSPSLLARLLDAERGGHFRLQPEAPFDSHFRYLDASGVLVTTFEADGAEATLTDFMPLRSPGRAGSPEQPVPLRRLVRLLEVQRGEMTFALSFRPGPDYARKPADLVSAADGFEARGDGYRLVSGVSLAVDRAEASATITLKAGERQVFVLDLTADDRPLELQDAWDWLGETLDFWKAWCTGCTYSGPFLDSVLRSTITLKLLTYTPTGAMIAAPTCALPEVIGGVRNWDYRYTWIRDASLSAFALFEAGHSGDAARFMAWIDTVAQTEKGHDSLHIMYDVEGRTDLAETHLDHLAGYEGSRPVHIGNKASEQFQLDVYGYLLDAFNAYRLLDALPHDKVAEQWPAFRAQVDAVCVCWRYPDSGIWEVRTEPLHYVSSKVMAWVAVDRGIRIAEDEGLEADLAHWRGEREAIVLDILDQGLSAGGTFKRAYGQDAQDASNLLAVLSHFMRADDPRLEATLRAIEEELVEDGLVYRYRVPDGLPGREGAFLPCSFWLVDTYLSQGRRDKALALFERMLTRASPLGLYAEELDPGSGAMLGNYPQALTHLGLINAAVNLARAGLGHVPELPQEQLEDLIGADELT